MGLVALRWDIQACTFPTVSGKASWVCPLASVRHRTSSSPQRLRRQHQRPTPPTAPHCRSSDSSSCSCSTCVCVSSSHFLAGANAPGLAVSIVLQGPRFRAVQWILFRTWLWCQCMANVSNFLFFEVQISLVDPIPSILSHDPPVLVYQTVSQEGSSKILPLMLDCGIAGTLA